MEKLITKTELSKVENNLLNTPQLNVLMSKTPQGHIYKRPGKGGETWEYVTGVYVKKVLNLMFGWNWDFEVEKFDINIEARQCIVLGKLTCRVGENRIVKMQFGRADMKFKKSGEPLDLGNDLKAATTDALKKCASEIGIASDIYGKNEFKEVFVVENKPTVDQLIFVEELLEQVKIPDNELRALQIRIARADQTEIAEIIDQLKELIEGDPIEYGRNYSQTDIKNKLNKFVK
jgi:recombination DNA repair RAD52 pathway protein